MKQFTTLAGLICICVAPALSQQRDEALRSLRNQVTAISKAPVARGQIDLRAITIQPAFPASDHFKALSFQQLAAQGCGHIDDPACGGLHLFRPIVNPPRQSIEFFRSMHSAIDAVIREDGGCDKCPECPKCPKLSIPAPLAFRQLAYRLMLAPNIGGARKVIQQMQSLLHRM